MAGEHSDRALWNERYRSGEHPYRDEPSLLVRSTIDWLPSGRALDVATGTGRHALFFAEHGYEVDAIDIAEEGLKRARASAIERGLSVNWILADLESFVFPANRYEVVTVIGYYGPGLISKLRAAMKPGGVLLYEHHLGPSSMADHGPSDEFRYEPNELLDACRAFHVLDYRERLRIDRVTGESNPKVSLIARKPTNDEPLYPPEITAELN